MLKLGRMILLLAVVLLGMTQPGFARTGLIKTAVGVPWSQIITDPTPPYPLELHKIVIDTDRNLYVHDCNRIRKVNQNSGWDTVIAGGGSINSDYAEGQPGNEVDFDIQDFTVDSSGNVYILDFDRIFKVSATTRVTSIVGGSNEFCGDFDNTVIDGNAATSGRINASRLAVDSEGNIFFITDDSFEGGSQSDQIRRIDALTGIVTTIAGSGDPGFSGDGKKATEASFYHASDIAIAKDGDIYIADQLNFRVRKIDAATGIINTIAGNGDPDFNTDGVPATQAGIYPYSIALDLNENVYINGGVWIWKVDAANEILHTIAGNGSYGFSGDDRPALEARLQIGSIAFNPVSGDLYLGDTAKGFIRVINHSTGIIKTFAGSESWHFAGDDGPLESALLYLPYDVATDPSGNLYIADTGNNRIRRVDAITHRITTIAGCMEVGYNGDGIPAISASLNQPQSIAVDSEGNFYIADTNNRRIRKVEAATLQITTIAGGGSKLADNGIPATEALFETITGVTVDRDQNVYVTDYGTGLVRKIDHATGFIRTVAGNVMADWDPYRNGIPATDACLQGARNTVVDSSGNLYIVVHDFDLIRKVDAQTGLINTIFNTEDKERWRFHGFTDVAIDTQGNLLVASENDDAVLQIDLSTLNYEIIAGGGYLTDDNISALKATLIIPTGITVDPNGNLLIAEHWMDRIRKVIGVSSLKKTLQLNSGWNMVSLSSSILYDRTDDSWAGLLGTAPEKVKAWSAQNSNYMNVDFHDFRDETFWFKMNSRGTLTFDNFNNGLSTTYQLYGSSTSGWNLIGNPFVVPLYWNVDRIHIRYGGETLTLREASTRGIVRSYGWTWNGTSYQLVCDPQIYPIDDSVQTIPPFSGIWLKALGDCQIVLDSE